MSQIIEYTEEDITKKERLEARTTLTVKNLIQRAAIIEGRSVSDFVVDHAQEAAKSVIERHNSISLSIDDSISFVNTLMNPPEPNKDLQMASKRHKELIKNR